MRAAGFPLFLAYAAFPAAAYAQRLSGIAEFRNWIDAAWLAAAFAALILLMLRRSLPFTRPSALLAATLLSGLMLLAVIRFGPQLAAGISPIPWLMELKPLFYLAVAFLWFSAFSAPVAGSFVRYGLVLSGFLLAEFVLTGLMEGRVVRPAGSGEINYDACLLLISLAVGMYSGVLSRTAHLILFAALAATFSRTGMAAAGVLYLTAPGRGAAFKVAVAAAAAGLFLLSFKVRGLPMDALEQLDRMCMWRAGIELIRENPVRALIGFAPGAPLPVSVPAGLEFLWAKQKAAWGLSGIYAFNLHSFWLRITVTWGLATAGLLTAAAALAYLRAGSRHIRGLIAVSCVMGLTMGLIYLSNVAVPLILAFLAGTQQLAPIRDSRG